MLFIIYIINLHMELAFRYFLEIKLYNEILEFIILNYIYYWKFIINLISDVSKMLCADLCNMYVQFLKRSEK